MHTTTNQSVTRSIHWNNNQILCWHYNSCYASFLELPWPARDYNKTKIGSKGGADFPHQGCTQQRVTWWVMTSSRVTYQHEFMSLNTRLMNGAHWTYPKIQPTVIKLWQSNRTWAIQSQEDSWVHLCFLDKYKLILALISFKIISTVGTSHGEQADGKSHIGGAMGLECDTSC